MHFQHIPKLKAPLSLPAIDWSNMYVIRLSSAAYYFC